MFYPTLCLSYINPCSLWLLGSFPWTLWGKKLNKASCRTPYEALSHSLLQRPEELSSQLSWAPSAAADLPVPPEHPLKDASLGRLWHNLRSTCALEPSWTYGHVAYRCVNVLWKMCCKRMKEIPISSCLIHTGVQRPHPKNCSISAVTSSQITYTANTDVIRLK